MSHRLDRVRDLLLEVGSEVLRLIKDPGLGQELVTLTDVKVSPDLSQARFFVSVLATPERQTEVLAGLERASGFFRKSMRERMRLKRIPEVHFTLDRTMEEAAALMDLIGRQQHPSAGPGQRESLEEAEGPPARETDRRS